MLDIEPTSIAHHHRMRDEALITSAEYCIIVLEMEVIEEFLTIMVT
jgi:hypothetical protein